MFIGCDELTIIGFEDSFAESYANYYSIPFVSAYILPISASGCRIDFEIGLIWGLATGLGVEDLEDNFIKLAPGCELVSTSQIVGTFTQIDVVDRNSVPNRTVASYYLIIFGDLNGDGAIDSNDSGIITDFENFLFDRGEANETLIRLGDINNDGVLDSGDAGLLTDCENFLVNINQVTGLAG